MAVRSLFEVKQQLCVLVPGWVTALVRVALLIDCSENQEPNVGKQCSMHLYEHAAVHPLSKTCASKTNPQSVRNAIHNNNYCDMKKELEKSNILKSIQ